MASPDFFFFFPAKAFCILRALSPDTLEALKSSETRSDDVIFTIFPKTAEAFFLDEEASAAVQMCATARNTAIMPMTG